MCHKNTLGEIERDRKENERLRQKEPMIVTFMKEYMKKEVVHE